MSTLHLSQNHLKQPPKQLNEGIIIVELFENEISSLSMIDFEDAKSGWNQVTEFYVDHNLLTSVPLSLCFGMQSLTNLTLHNNKLQSLPSNIGSLSNLKELRVDHNELKTLPGSICDLKQLQLLHIDGNHIHSLPQNIGFLSNLLDFGIGSCRIYKLPISFLKLKKLVLLWFEQRSFDNVPAQIIMNANADTKEHIMAYMDMMYNLCIPSLEQYFDDIAADD